MIRALSVIKFKIKMLVKKAQSLSWPEPVGVAPGSPGRLRPVRCCDTTPLEGKAARRLYPGVGRGGRVRAVFSDGG